MILFVLLNTNIVNNMCSVTNTKRERNIIRHSL